MANNKNILATEIKKVLEYSSASAWTEKLKDCGYSDGRMCVWEGMDTSLYGKKVAQTDATKEAVAAGLDLGVRVMIADGNEIRDNFKGVSLERAADIIIGAREHNGLTLTSNLSVKFGWKEDFERGTKMFGNTGESTLWAQDWNEGTLTMDFCDAGPLDELERTVRSELDRLGFENYCTINGGELWV